MRSGDISIIHVHTMPVLWHLFVLAVHQDLIIRKGTVMSHTHNKCVTDTTDCMYKVLSLESHQEGCGFDLFSFILLCKHNCFLSLVVFL